MGIDPLWSPSDDELPEDFWYIVVAGFWHKTTKAEVDRCRKWRGELVGWRHHDGDVTNIHDEYHQEFVFHDLYGSQVVCWPSTVYMIVESRKEVRAMEDRHGEWLKTEFKEDFE